MTFNAATWAATSKGKATKTCQTCAVPAYRSAIRDALKTWAGGEGVANIQALHRALVEHLEYPLAYKTLHSHVSTCERELWEIIHAETA